MRAILQGTLGEHCPLESKVALFVVVIFSPLAWLLAKSPTVVKAPTVPSPCLPFPHLCEVMVSGRDSLKGLRVLRALGRWWAWGSQIPGLAFLHKRGLPPTLSRLLWMLPGQFNQLRSCARSGFGLMLTQMAWAARAVGTMGLLGVPRGKEGIGG